MQVISWSFKFVLVILPTFVDSTSNVECKAYFLIFLSLIYIFAFPHLDCREGRVLLSSFWLSFFPHFRILHPMHSSGPSFQVFFMCSTLWLFPIPHVKCEVHRVLFPSPHSQVCAIASEFSHSESLYFCISTFNLAFLDLHIQWPRINQCYIIISFVNCNCVKKHIIYISGDIM